MQKKDSNQRRHLPGWCGPECLSWRAPWGPGFTFVSSASVSSNSSSSNVSFLNGVWISILVSIRVDQYSIGVITKEMVSSWWKHQNFPTRLLKHGNGNVDDPQRWIQAFISISGFIQIWLVWLSLPAVLHELLTWLVTSSRQRLTRNTEQEDVTTLWVRHWWRHTSMTGSGGFTPGSPVSTHKKI